MRRASFFAMLAAGLSLGLSSCGEEHVLNADGKTVLTMAQYEELQIRLQAEAQQAEIREAQQEAVEEFGTHFNRAVALYRRREYDRALASFDEAVKQHPGNARAWYMRGMTLRQLGNESAANESFTRAYEISTTRQTSGATTRN